MMAMLLLGIIAMGAFLPPLHAGISDEGPKAALIEGSELSVAACSKQGPADGGLRQGRGHGSEEPQGDES